MSLAILPDELQSHLDYDVIIIGGRPAGANLAARLGQVGVQVLIVEPESMTSRPPVSCPVLFNSSMALLDEIGITESDYAYDHVRLAGMALEMGAYFHALVPMPNLAGRPYMYGVDRYIFDAALWNNLRRFPSVETRENYVVQELIFDDLGHVIGIEGRMRGQAPQQLIAGCVIGADGRFSWLARKVGAAVVEEVAHVNTCFYYAYWSDVRPYRTQNQEWMQVYNGMDGFSLSVIPTTGTTAGVVAQCRQDYFNDDDDYETWYLETLQRHPRIWERLTNATRISEISGLRKVPNLYREAAGPGWALVGQAYHQKDPFDGQDIYDALLEGKLLAHALVAWHKGQTSWEKAMEWYTQQAYSHTYAMYRASLNRLRREVYGEPHPLLANNVLRWLMTHPEYRERLGNLVCRNNDPANWLRVPFMTRAIAEGFWEDLRRRRRKETDPSTLMPPFD